MTASALVYAFFGGLAPSLVWLYFLLKEDSRCPEPKRLIALAFVAGMAAVPLALPLEIYAQSSLNGTPLLAWAVIEELLKYLMAALFILWRSAVDERVDFVIYMMTVALGFAAAENMLFLFAPLSAGQFGAGFFMGDQRFIGATLLHVVASSVVGFSLALSSVAHPVRRVLAVTAGLILAIGLHTLFNTIIMQSSDTSTLDAFFLVWVAVVAVFAGLEVLKYFRYRNLPPNTC